MPQGPEGGQAAGAEVAAPEGVLCASKGPTRPADELHADAR